MRHDFILFIFRHKRYYESKHSCTIVFRCASRTDNIAAIDVVWRRRQCYASSKCGSHQRQTKIQVKCFWFSHFSILTETTFLNIKLISISRCSFDSFRGLMLDTSRNYFSVDTIKRMLVGMSHSKLNRFHWHITDSQSFPFASKAYPQMAQYGAYSSKEIYTVEDVKNIAEYARVRGIQVLPEIDAPAHSGNGWDWGPKHGLGDLSLCVNQQPWTSYCGEPPCGQLNPRNNNTYKILEKIYGELLEATGPSDFFHIGGDEVNLECWSQFFNDTELRSLWCEFMLQAYQRWVAALQFHWPIEKPFDCLCSSLKAANKNIAPKIVAVWSSGLTSTQCLSSKDFAVQLWGGSDWQENYAILQSGFNVIISHVDAWYFDCGFGSWRTTGEGACSPYTTWQRVYRHRPWDRMRLDPQRMKQILGGEACLWTEQVDEGNVDARLWPRSAALAERYTEYNVIMNTPFIDWINTFLVFQTVDWSIRSDRIRYYAKGDFPSSIDLSKSFASIWNRSWANVSQILCTKSRWMRMIDDIKYLKSNLFTFFDFYFSFVQFLLKWSLNLYFLRVTHYFWRKKSK